MTLRDIRQQEFANAWIEDGEFGILHLCPRFGKIRTSINIFKKYDDDVRILIAYPDENIKNSWMADFEEMGYTNPNVVFTTHMSLKKQVENDFFLVVIDEIHLLSEAQILVCTELFKRTNKVLGLSGTLSKETRWILKKELYLFVIAEYPLEKAIEEGVIVDYQITVIKTPLDTKLIQTFGKKSTNEKKRFDNLSYVIDKMEEDGKNTMFMRLARMRVIQSSHAKKQLTKRIIDKYKEERILVFCGQIKIAESLGIPCYHSKSKNKEEFLDFVEGTGNHMAVINIGNTGVTYKPLNRVVINYFDSNGENLAQKIQRCTAMEYNNPDKKAHIYIISSDESVEQKWLKRALEFFSPEKIKYIMASEL